MRGSLCCWLLLIGVDWCWLVLIGVDCFWLVLIGVGVDRRWLVLIAVANPTALFSTLSTEPVLTANNRRHQPLPLPAVRRSDTAVALPQFTSYVLLQTISTGCLTHCMYWDNSRRTNVNVLEDFLGRWHTFRCILFDGMNISFDANLVIFI